MVFAIIHFRTSLQRRAGWPFKFVFFVFFPGGMWREQRTGRRIDVNLWVLTRNSLPLPCKLGKVHSQKNKLSVLLAAPLHGFNFHHLLPSCLHAFHFCRTFFTNSVASFFYICKCCWLWKRSMFTLNPWPFQGLL